jgi:glycosyltransferase involved in cell wall biosynthesis
VDGRYGGIRDKILAQAAAWAELDSSVEVGLFVRCEHDARHDWIGQPRVVSVRSSAAGIAGRYVQRELLSIDVGRWRPDLIYLRQSTVSPSIVALAAAVPTIVELNTLDLDELKIRSPARYLYSRASRPMVLRTARGIVAPSSDIAAHPTVQKFGHPVEVVPNAIDLSLYPQLPAPTNPAPRVAFLGSPRTPWHGLDKINLMARRFPSWRFDVVGPSAGELADPSPNVVVHGLLESDAFRPILAGADVAIGPLAFHRLRLDEASPLKVAEYLAYGLPVIVGYTDARFPDGAPFLLQIPNRDDGIDASLGEIRRFVASWMGRRVSRDDVALIDSRFVERRRLTFMLDRAGDRRRAEAP